MKVGFVGLGNMGLAMARNLVHAGHELTVYNRTRSRADELVKLGAKAADSPAATASTGVVLTMLADDRAVESVVFGGLLDALPSDGLHVSMSTVSVELSKRLAEAHRQRGQHYVAAPVFGRPEVAAGAKLFIFAAGEKAQVDRCHSLFAAMGQRTFYMGAEAPRANVLKLSGNFLIMAMIESFAEAIALVRKYGIEAQEFVELMTSTMFTAPVSRNYGMIIAQEKFEPAGFRLVLGLKDARLILAAAEGAAVPMPTASVFHDQYLSGVARGMSDLDWSAIGRVAAENAGLK
jgi:3-hydroxyisobutyrate dehydrogenase-like beta-hydroxyacid dehydrogenase